MEMDDEELMAMLSEDPNYEASPDVPLPLDAEEAAFVRSSHELERSRGLSQNTGVRPTLGSQPPSQMDDDELAWLLYGDSEPQENQRVSQHDQAAIQRDDVNFFGQGTSSRSKDSEPVEDDEIMDMMEAEVGGASQSQARPQPQASVPASAQGPSIGGSMQYTPGPVRLVAAPSKHAGVHADEMTVTGPSGDRVYVKVDALPAAPTTPPQHSLRGMQLLSEPIDTLLDRLEEQRYEAARQESERLAEVAELGQLGARLDAAHKKKGKRSRRLWVDKYAPKQFPDLLSHDQTNREVLRWLKAWDTTVFGVPPKTKPRTIKNTRGNWELDKFSALEQQQSAKFFSAAGVPLENDKRPAQKIILLCGPPGLGKTTLAHVVAKHCGYNVVEINASDDRSSAALCDKVASAVEFQAVMGDRRPNCVVIDEIDGAIGGAEGRSTIEALVQLVTRTRKSNEGEGGDETVQKKSKGGKGGKKGPPVLNRPIICVCNDAFVAALRPLRQVATVFKFIKPHPGRLYKRLSQVCLEENITVEGRALGVLCSNTECDIRQCLHTLQFLARKSHRVTLEDVNASSAGKKDMTIQAMQAIGEIFSQRLLTPFERSQQNSSESGKSVEQKELLRVYNRLMAVGDDKLVINGVHENLLSAKFHDVNMTRMGECLDWLCFADKTMTSIRSQTNFSLMPYVPVSALAIRHIVIQPGRMKTEYPTKAAQVNRESAANRTLVSGWIASTSPRVQVGLNCDVAVRDTIPYLVTVLCPSLRAVPLQMLNAREQASFRDLVAVMVDHHLTYCLDTPQGAGINMFNPNAQHSGNGSPHAGVDLVPAIDTLLMFSSMNERLPRRATGFALRQMLNQEAQNETIRQNACADSSTGDARSAQNGGALECQVTAMEVVEEAKSDTGSHGAALKRSHTEVGTEQPPTLIQQYKKLDRKMAGGAGGAIGNKLIHFPVLYNYNEGFTNAVRRSVTMESLWKK